MPEEKLLFTKAEWETASADVTREMNAYLAPFVTAVSKDHVDHGELVGSGTYLDIAGRTVILTNEHVAAEKGSGHLIHGFHNLANLYRSTGDHLVAPFPADIAILPIASAMWAAPDHGAKAITKDMILPVHKALEGELFVFMGFAGARCTFAFGTLFTRATSSVSREVPLPPEDDRFDANFHVGVDYKPDLATKVEGAYDLPPPPGFSGSTLWNTRFVECSMAGTPWTPHEARVTGLVWGWPSSHGCIVATRAELLHEFIDIAAQQISSGELRAI
jgi:hypothetical protein